LHYYCLIIACAQQANQSQIKVIATDCNNYQNIITVDRKCQIVMKFSPEATGTHLPRHTTWRLPSRRCCRKNTGTPMFMTC
jgi:hypothetical protein